MNIINLYEYIKNWAFINELWKIFDIVVDENKLKELWYEFGVSGVLSWLNKNYKNILIIIDSLNYEYFIPYIKSNNWKSDSNYTIINLWTGITWFLNKSNPDIDDIWVLTNYNISIYEPYDHESLKQILNKKENKYIRISDKDIAKNLFESEDTVINKSWNIIWLTDLWYWW
jgi:hypothetical protein